MAEDVVAHLHPQHPASAARAAECLDLIVECRRVETGYESVCALLHFPAVCIERFDI